MNIDFVKKMLIDFPENRHIRSKFLRKEKITEEEKSEVLKSNGRWLSKSDLSNFLVFVDWPGLNKLQELIKDTIENNIDGDFIETGVWKGGMCILAKCIYDELQINKKVFVADSFEGLPPPDIEKYPCDKGDIHYSLPGLSISLEQVQDNFRLFDCLDDNVVFIKGWFKDSLPTAPVEKLSILRLDGDMYEATINSLDNLYHKLSVGGYCIIDDYEGHAGCKQAVNDFRIKHNITEELIKIDNVNPSQEHYWKKER